MRLFLVFFGIALSPALQAQETASSEPSPRSVMNYVLGPGDELAIKAVEGEEFSNAPYRIDPDGFIELPFIGSVNCTGLTIRQLQVSVVEKLKKYIRQPQISIRLVEIRSRPVSVLGAVKKPGIQQLHSETTLVEMLSLSGGLADDAGDTITISRKLEWGKLPIADSSESEGYSVAKVSSKALLISRTPQLNIMIRPNDVISVLRAEKVFVMGQVKKAGGFLISDRQSMSVLEALAAAEGMTNIARPQDARILRARTESPNREEISVNLKEILAGKRSDVPLQPNDILFVPDNIPKSATLRAVEAAIQIGTGVVVWRR